jgi:glycosyl hydrolase family 26
VLKKLPALATTALIAAGLIAGPTTAGAANAETTPANRSGLAWNSGVYIPGDNATATESFGSWRGAKTDVAVTWTARSNWNDVINSTWLYDRWKNAPQTLALGLPPFPENVGGSLAACAAGSYNGYWKQFGTTIKNSGLSDKTIIRLGWEFNGNWFAWSARNPGEFAACWRQVQTSAESTAPALRWDWNVNRGTSQLGIDSRQAYPGDAYVDIVGVDSYDGWPGVKTDADWNEHLNGAYGLKMWADFARQHGKKLSIPEWGVYPGTAWAGHNGGDNPLYIQKMFGFFKSQQDNLAYEAYFNEPASYVAGALELNPKAAAEYRTQIATARTATPAAPSTPAPSAAATATPVPSATTTAAPTATATTAPTATVTSPAVTVTSPAVTVTATATVTAPPVTVTVTAPPVTVTAPPVTVTAPAVTVTSPPVTVTVTKAPKPTSTKSPKPTATPKPKVKSTKPATVKAKNVSVFTIVKLVQKVEAKTKKADAAKTHAAKIKAAKIKKAAAKAKAQTVRKGVQAKSTVRH